MGLDGVYRWKSPVQLDSDKEGIRLILIVCVIVCALSILICAIISMEFMLHILPAILGSVAAAILFFLLIGKLSDSIVQKYEMNDQYVKIGDDKASVTYSYHMINEIIVNPLHLELHDNTNTSRIYVPKEDFYFVKEYIINHTMGNAVVRNKLM